MQSLTGLVERICRDVRASDDEFRMLYRRNLKTYPIPFFGNIQQAEILTLCLNPSSTEFEPWRNWPVDNIGVYQLESRLKAYFHAFYPRPHPWFASIEEALNILNCSYQTNAAHIDLSPRATRSFRYSKGSEFTKMLLRDCKWITELLTFAKRRKLIVIINECGNFRIDGFLKENSPDLWRQIEADYISCDSRQKLSYLFFENCENLKARLRNSQNL